MDKKPLPFQIAQAHDARLSLASAALFPTSNINGRDDLATYEENMRRELPALVGELDRTDLAAVHQLVKLLAMTPRDDDQLFAYIAQRDAHVVRAVTGESDK